MGCLLFLVLVCIFAVSPFAAIVLVAVGIVGFCILLAAGIIANALAAHSGSDNTLSSRPVQSTTGRQHLALDIGKYGEEWKLPEWSDENEYHTVVTEMLQILAVQELTEREICARIGGERSIVRKALKALLTNKKLNRFGPGTVTEPYRYRLRNDSQFLVQ